MTTDLGNSVRTEVARILMRYSGQDKAALPVPTLQKVAQVLDEEDQRAKACTCGANHRTYQIPASCDSAPYEAMSNARIDRTREADGDRFADIDIAVRARQEAHGRISQ